MKKPKEQTSPSYIDIVNWYWEHAIYFEGYKPEYAVLFFAIIDSVNKNYWRQTDLEYDRIINKTKLSKRAYLDARRWLMSNQIIDFVEGKNEFAKAKFSLGVAVQNCTSTVPPVHLQCSSSVPPVHLQCSSDAPSIKDNKDLTDKKDKKDLKDFIAPTFDDFNSFCLENGFEHIAKKAFDYYSANDWKDNQNKKVKNWKLKLQSVWFDENKNPKPSNNASNQNMLMSHEEKHIHKKLPDPMMLTEATYYSECIERFIEPLDYHTLKPLDLSLDVITLPVDYSKTILKK